MGKSFEAKEVRLRTSLPMMPLFSGRFLEGRGELKNDFAFKIKYNKCSAIFFYNVTV